MWSPTVKDCPGAIAVVSEIRRTSRPLVLSAPKMTGEKKIRARLVISRRGIVREGSLSFTPKVASSFQTIDTLVL
tara:strand:- start:1500 stop:1724 length:225 start_codon:yes stop_codon:yes gene_type:complete